MIDMDDDDEVLPDLRTQRLTRDKNLKIPRSRLARVGYQCVGKVQYTLPQARFMCKIAKNRGQIQQPYRCPHCHSWHTGNVLVTRRT